MGHLVLRRARRRVTGTITAIAVALPLGFVALTPTPATAAPGVAYDYPVDPGTPEWAAFTHHTQMVDATQIPRATLDAMSTPDLVASVLAYPLFLDRLAFNTPQQGFDRMSSRFDGFAELYSRPDAPEVLLDLYRATTRREIAAGPSDTDDRSDLANLEMILAQPEVLAASDVEALDQTIIVATTWVDALQQAPEITTPSEEEPALLLAARANALLAGVGGPQWDAGSFLATGQAVSAEVLEDVENAVWARQSIPMPDEITPRYRDSYGTVNTPNRSGVAVRVTSFEFSSGEIAAGNNWVAKNYPRAVRETNTSRRFNCHSFAWYTQTTGNIRWMDSPGDDRYWQDASYVRWTPNMPQKTNKRMSWVSDDHSAMHFTNVGWKSKWGSLPIMRHTVDYTPYTDTTLYQYYRYGT